MGQELGFVHRDDTLILTTNDESVTFVDVESLIEEYRGVRALKI